MHLLWPSYSFLGQSLGLALFLELRQHHSFPLRNLRTPSLCHSFPHQWLNLLHLRFQTLLDRLLLHLPQSQKHLPIIVPTLILLLLIVALNNVRNWIRNYYSATVSRMLEAFAFLHSHYFDTQGEYHSHVQLVNRMCLLVQCLPELSPLYNLCRFGLCHPMEQRNMSMGVFYLLHLLISYLKSPEVNRHC